MSTFKNCKIIMLPTKGKGPIVLGENLLVNLSGVFRGTNFHLYIVSDDEIKEGDWVICGQNDPYQIKKEDLTPFLNKYNKKIIATTDTSLVRIISRPLGVTQELPQPSQSFIEKYIESYNKGNVITDVMVEYEEWHEEDTSKSYIQGKGQPAIKLVELKINSKDNTINIKQMKDSYTREEVMEIAAKAHSHGYSLCLGSSDNILEFEDWIKENL